MVPSILHRGLPDVYHSDEISIEELDFLKFSRSSEVLVLTTTFNSAKISLLVFIYRDFGEQIEDPRMFDVTNETRDDTSVIILKSRLTLQVILPARASLVTPSLIDDSTHP